MTLPYGNLVRDRLPEVIRSTGATPVVSIVPKCDRLHHLRLKMLEEVHNLFRSADQASFLKDAADVVEVLRAMAQEYGIAWGQVEQARTVEASERGSFDEGVFLHTVYEQGTSIAPDSVELITPSLVISGASPSLLDVLRRELHTSYLCKIATAFCTRAMLNVLLRPFDQFLARGGELYLLTSVMNHFNDPDDLLHLRGELPDCRLRIFYPGQGDGAQRFLAAPAPFHLKCFLFHKQDGRHALIIGSSNLTGGGLARNEEWNLYSNSEVNLPFRLGDSRTIFDTAEETFRGYWERDAVEVTDEFLAAYRPRWEQSHRATQSLRDTIALSLPAIPRPRQPQVRALASLALRREYGICRCAVIGATGLGKTHLAAFDFQQSGMANVLFVAHRENILREAQDVFRCVLRDAHFGIVLSGQSSASERQAARADNQSVFAMIQTLSRARLKQFARYQFDYVVVDEFHHSEAASYRRVLEYFKPRFLLGLTATPERMDGRDVLRWCDYNIAYEARLFDAIEQGWLAPFQYFAVYDESEYSDIRWTGTGYDEAELAERLSTDTRADIIVRNLKRFLPATGKTKALAFCVNRAHAQYMTAAFASRGVEAVCILGDSPEAARLGTIERLQDEEDPLQVVCAVDVLSEGVDIPLLTHVLLLRPTLSFTVFLQQLGRGLRQAPGKDYLVALDFVGNWRNSYVVPLVLRGCTSLDEARKRPPGRTFSLPAGCSVDADTDVQRIWDAELRRAMAPRNRRQLLQETYRRLRDDLGRVPMLLDFLANPDACDPQAFVRHFGNWLRTKEDAGDLTEYEQQLLDTPGEGFLQHIEKELNPVRSYKMVVLLVLLYDDPTSTKWDIDWIAREFRQHYLDHRDQLTDCSPLAQASNPESVPLAKIRSLLKGMPLKYLSNTEADYFNFHRDSGIFALKRRVHAHWHDPRFRELLQERVIYSLTRYFHQKGIDVSGFACEQETRESPQEAEDIVRPSGATTSVPFFPTLRVAAGFFREGAGYREQSSIEVPDRGGRLRPDRHFVVQVEGDSMNGGLRPIHDGHFVVLEIIDASRAGSLTAERAIAVEYRDDTGDTAYALKEVRKDASGAYWLHSWNARYEDIAVDPDNMFPFARLIEAVGTLPPD